MTGSIDGGGTDDPGPARGAGRRESLGLLRRRPGFARLSAVELLSPLGDSMGILALILYVQALGGSATNVGLLLLADTIAPLLSPIAGTLVDRVDRRTVLIVGAALQGVVVALIALLLPPLPILFALVFGRGLLATAFQPAVRVSVPLLVEDADLPAANSVLGAGREIGAVVGPPLAGLLFPFLHARGVLAVDAMSFLVAVPLLAGLPRLRPPGPDGAPRGSAPGPEADTDQHMTERRRLVRDTIDGLRFVLTDRLTRAVAVGLWLVVLTSGADDLILPFLGRDAFHSGSLGIGVLLAGASVGVIGGLGVLVRYGRVVVGVRALLAGFALASTGNLLTAFAPSVGVAVSTQVLRGVGLALVDASVQTALQRGVPRHLVGRAMANVWGGVSVAAALSYAIGGPLLDATGPRTMFVVVGAGGLAATLLSTVLLRGRVEGPDPT